MSLATTNDTLPPIPPTTSNTVTPSERTSAIDFVNRVNFLFEEFNPDKMLTAFHADAVVHHFHGRIQGHAQMRAFLENDYPYLIPGVARHATNHVVDRDGEDGVTVRYHEQLVRYAWPDESEAGGGKGKAPGEHPLGTLLQHHHDEEEGGGRGSGQRLPGIWLFTHMLDRLRKTDEGEWKIAERYLGVSAVNRNLDPPSGQAAS